MEGHPKLADLSSNDDKLKKIKKRRLMKTTFDSLSKKCIPVKNQIHSSYDNMITDYLLDNAINAIADLTVHIKSNSDKATDVILKTKEYQDLSNFYESLSGKYKADLVPISARRDERESHKSLISNLSFNINYLQKVKDVIKPEYNFHDLRSLYDLLKTDLTDEDKDTINLKIKILEESKQNHGRSISKNT